MDQVIRSAPGAFENFYGRYGQLIRSCVRKRAETRDVDDLFQGLFEHLIKNDYRVLQVWQRGNSLPIYLSTVVRNHVIDFQRRRRRPEKAKVILGREASSIRTPGPENRRGNGYDRHPASRN